MPQPHVTQRPSARNPHLDSLDSAMIRALQEDGRATIHDLATSLGISRDAASLRLKRLTEQEGVRVVAAVDPHFAGHHMLTHVSVSVDGPLDPVAEAITDFPDTVFVSKTSGTYPLVFESRHEGPAELHSLLNRVRLLPGVRAVLVTTYTEILSGFFVANRRLPVTIDEFDTALIKLLQRDGRLSFSALAARVHLSPSSVRTRVHRLIDAGVIRISAITSGQLTRSRIAVGVGISATGDTAPIRAALLAFPDIDFAAQTHGRFDYIATLEGPSAAHLLTTLEALRAIPSVSLIETWTHFDIVKENYERAIERAVGR